MPHRFPFIYDSVFDLLRLQRLVDAAAAGKIHLFRNALGRGRGGGGENVDGAESGSREGEGGVGPRGAVTGAGFVKGRVAVGGISLGGMHSLFACVASDGFDVAFPLIGE